jgi:hypothetical protein
MTSRRRIRIIRTEFLSGEHGTVFPQKQLSEYYSNFQLKMFESPKHIMTFCRRIRIVLTELFSGENGKQNMCFCPLVGSPYRKNWFGLLRWILKI